MGLVAVGVLRRLQLLGLLPRPRLLRRVVVVQAVEEQQRTGDNVVDKAGPDLPHARAHINVLSRMSGIRSVYKHHLIQAKEIQFEQKHLETYEQPSKVFS